MNVKPIVKTIALWCRKHATKLLAAGAIGAEILGFWAMHKEAPVVRERLDALPEDAKWFDKVKVAGPVYLPALGLLLASCGCVVGGCAIGEKKIAALTGLYSMSEAALRKYESKVVDMIGTEKAKEIHDAAAQDVINEHPVTDTTIIATGKGDVLFYEPLTGRYFTSDPNEVIAAMNRCNKRIISEMWISVNEWFGELGLEESGLGEMAGWNVDHMIDIPDNPQSFPTGVSIDNRPCFVIAYYNRPIMYK